MYGKELIIDMHNCDSKMFTRGLIALYIVKLCSKIDMVREDLHFWDYNGDSDGYEKAPNHLKGISCIQFIKTSNITIHSLDVLRKVFINIFSCKDFDSDLVVEFSKKYFGGKIANRMVINRL